MPMPSKKQNEDKASFMSRCMSDRVMSDEYPDAKQRTAVCMSRACEDTRHIEAMDFEMYYLSYGSEEELNEDNLYIPEDYEYVLSSEVFYEDSEIEEFDISVAKPGLWENIRKKKDREGKKYKPAKPGDPDRPDPESWKKAQSLWKNVLAEYDEGQMQREQLMKMHQQLMEIEKELSGVKFEDWTKDMISKSELYIQNIYDFVKFYDSEESSYAKFKYEDPKTGEVYTYSRPGVYKKDGRILVRVRAAEYQGRKVQLGKPFRTPDGPKKFSVYVKNDKGNVVKVNFGDPNMSIKKSDPARRKSFRARHNCDNPGPKWKARYWSCRAW